MSFTITLTGQKSVLSADYSPPLHLTTNTNIDGGEWVIGLVDFQSYNSIPNIIEGRNKFYYYEKNNNLKYIIIPPGSYDIEDLSDYIRSKIGDPDYHIEHNEHHQQNEKEKIKFLLTPNANTLKCKISCSNKIDFTKEDSIGSMLGFSKKLLDENKIHESDSIVNIMKVNSIQKNCNISSGSYRNNSNEHILHIFFPHAPPGYKIVEVPSNIIYLPVSVRVIDNVTVKIIDLEGDIIDFRGETITVRLHLKKSMGINFTSNKRVLNFKYNSTRLPSSARLTTKNINFLKAQGYRLKKNE